MSSLADLPDLVGFFSYSRSDDEHTDKALSLLRRRIRSELRLQLGRDLRLWQDTEAIPFGTLWEGEIKKAIAESVFFIPIITPSAVNSPYCRMEFEAFLERERKSAMRKKTCVGMATVRIRRRRIRSRGFSGRRLLAMIAMLTHRRPVIFRQMPSACTICSAMFGNGRRIAPRQLQRGAVRRLDVDSRRLQ